MRAAVVYGAVTPPRRLGRATQVLVEAVGSFDDVEVMLLDLFTLRLEMADGRPSEAYDESTRKAVDTIAGADAVVFGSPVFRASFPGALKNLLDLLPVEALEGKPVGIAAMGASTHHYLAVDNHLRSVLAWFGALVAPTSVYLTGADFIEGDLLEAARSQLWALAETVVTMARRLSGVSFGPRPLAGTIA